MNTGKLETIEQLPIRTDARLDLNRFRYAIQKPGAVPGTWEPAGFMPTLARARVHQEWQEQLRFFKRDPSANQRDVHNGVWFRMPKHRIIDIHTGEVFA